MAYAFVRGLNFLWLAGNQWAGQPITHFTNSTSLGLHSLVKNDGSGL